MIRMTWPMYRRRECAVWTVAIGRIGWRLISLSPMEAELLLFLLLRRSATTAEIIEWLWPNPDLEPDCALRCLRVYVLHLRQKLGRHSIWLLHASSETGHLRYAGARYALTS